MIRNAFIFALACYALSHLQAHAIDLGPRTFRAIALEGTEIHRLWIIPDGEDASRKWFGSPNCPVSYISEIGQVRLTGKMRLRKSLTFKDLLDAKHLDGLDLSYVELTLVDLKRISKIKSLRHLHLTGNKLNPDMLDVICSMTQLDFLNVVDTSLSETELMILRSRMTSVKIETSVDTPLTPASNGYRHIATKQKR